MTTYTYAVSATANNYVDCIKFVSDLDAQYDEGFSKNLFQVRWDLVNANFYIDFVQALSASAITVLDAVVATHAGQAYVNYYPYITYAPSNPLIGTSVKPYFLLTDTINPYLKLGLIEPQLPNIVGADHIHIRSIHLLRPVHPSFQFARVTAVLYHADGSPVTLSTQDYNSIPNFMEARVLEFNYPVQGDVPYMICFEYLCMPTNTCIQYGCAVEVIANG